MRITLEAYIGSLGSTVLKFSRTVLSLTTIASKMLPRILHFVFAALRSLVYLSLLLVSDLTLWAPQPFATHWYSPRWYLPRFHLSFSAFIYNFSVLPPASAFVVAPATTWVFLIPEYCRLDDRSLFVFPGATATQSPTFHQPGFLLPWF